MRDSIIPRASAPQYINTPATPEEAFMWQNTGDGLVYLRLDTGVDVPVSGSGASTLEDVLNAGDDANGLGMTNLGDITDSNAKKTYSPENRRLYNAAERSVIDYEQGFLYDYNGTRSVLFNLRQLTNVLDQVILDYGESKLKTGVGQEVMNWEQSKLIRGSSATVVLDWQNLETSDYINDAAAAAGGIATGQLYRTGNVIKMRIS